MDKIIDLKRIKDKKRCLDQLKEIEEEYVKKPHRDLQDAKNKRHFENKKTL